jgi:hypothetical protein
VEAVNRAWAEAGNPGTLSESLLGKVRSKLGLTGKGTSGAVAVPPAKGKTGSTPKGSKAVPKTTGAPSKSDGRGGGPGAGKTAFVEAALRRDPAANVAAVNRAWAAAGNPGTISDTVFYQIKRDLGRAGGKAAAPVKPAPGTAPTGAKSKPAAGARPRSDGVTAPSKAVGGSRSGERERVLDRLEDRIDDLFIELKQLGGMDEALEALRKVRRVVVRSHQG